LRYTGSTNLLSTCTRAADLLCKTFGDEPGKRDLIISGEQAGLAPTKRAGADGATLSADGRPTLS